MTYSDYEQHLQKIADLRHSYAVLQWDQETYMPPKSASLRGRQLATLSELAHRFFASQQTADMLERLLEQPTLSPMQRRNIELSLYDYNKAKKLSPEFVRQLTETVNRSFHSWIESRKLNSFARFEPDLSELVELKKQEAHLLGFTDHPYNALLNDYERGATVSLLDGVFANIRTPLKDLLQKIRSVPQVDDAFLHQHFSKDSQWNYGMQLLKQIGFDFEAGRQDISEHPFTTSFSPYDVRITTRIDEKDFNNMTWSTIHELGHALYEQGLPASEYGLPLGEACSLSIHESQSRLWENQVGRSLAFWRYHYPTLQKEFPQQLGQVPLDRFYAAINKVQPSLIRTEADEVTYHFHVMIRYELEKRLLEGSIRVADIPAYWNEQYEQYLGVKSPDDRNGCLQDVHWSHGSFGYFPTYSLGSFYAAQFFDQATRDIPSLQTEIENGTYQSLVNWLRQKIHVHGRYYTSEELCAQVCRQPLDITHFMQYLLDKYAKIYQF
ncbi:MAG TPA: carboxypeptidase M32 [Chitinophagaceae bacterium]|nr:carboxypeptidase M32 [Chitinophagaceae bacterium]